MENGRLFVMYLWEQFFKEVGERAMPFLNKPRMQADFLCDCVRRDFSDYYNGSFIHVVHSLADRFAAELVPILPRKRILSYGNFEDDDVIALTNEVVRDIYGNNKEYWDDAVLHFPDDMRPALLERFRHVPPDYS